MFRTELIENKEGNNFTSLFGQTHLINLLKALGYKFDERGVCVGDSMLFISSAILRKEHDIRGFRDYLNTVPTTEIVRKINIYKNQVKTHNHSSRADEETFFVSQMRVYSKEHLIQLYDLF